MVVDSPIGNRASVTGVRGRQDAEDGQGIAGIWRAGGGERSVKNQMKLYQRIAVVLLFVAIAFVDIGRRKIFCHSCSQSKPIRW